MEPRLALNTWWWWHWCQFDYYFCYARACKILLSSSWKAIETTVLFCARGVLAMHFKSWSMSAFLKGRQPALTCFFYPNYSETSFTYDHALDLHLPCSCSSLYWYPFNSHSNLFLLISRCYPVSHVLLMTLRLPLSFLWSAAVSWKLAKSLEKKSWKTF